MITDIGGRYGYYCLPILWGEELIGRLDAKAARESGRFEIRLLQLEPRTRHSGALMSALGEGLGKLAIANGCDHVEILRSEPRELGRAIPLPLR